MITKHENLLAPETCKVLFVADTPERRSMKDSFNMFSKLPDPPPDRCWKVLDWKKAAMYQFVVGLVYRPALAKYQLSILVYKETRPCWYDLRQYWRPCNSIR
jgi:hypothetical protein